MGILDTFKKNAGQNVSDEKKKSQQNTGGSGCCCCSDKEDLKAQQGEKDKHDCCA